MPSLPGNRRSVPVAERNAGTWIALAIVLGIITGLLVLISMVMPDIFGLLFVLAAFGGFVALHYFTWGRWLIRKNAELQAETPPPQVRQDTAREED